MGLCPLPLERPAEGERRADQHGSPTGAPAGLARAPLAELLERVDPRRVAIAPADLDGVPADQRHLVRPDVGRHGGRVQHPRPSELVDAGRTRAALAQRRVREHGLVAVGPDDVELPIVDAADLAGGRVHARPPIMPSGTASDWVPSCGSVRRRRVLQRFPSATAALAMLTGGSTSWRCSGSVSGWKWPGRRWIGSRTRQNAPPALPAKKTGLPPELSPRDADGGPRGLGSDGSLAGAWPSGAGDHLAVSSWTAGAFLPTPCPVVSRAGPRWARNHQRRGTVRSGRRRSPIAQSGLASNGHDCQAWGGRHARRMKASAARPDTATRSPRLRRRDPDTTMPANLTPEYKAAEAAFRKARDPRERLDCLREMLRVIPKHKGTDHLQGDIKRRIKELSRGARAARGVAAAHGGPAW